MNSLDAFNHHRRLLFGITYRMLGTVSDAENTGKKPFYAGSKPPKPRFLFAIQRRWLPTDSVHLVEINN